MASKQIWLALLRYARSSDELERATALLLGASELHKSLVSRFKSTELSLSKCINLLDTEVERKQLKRLAHYRNELVHRAWLIDSSEVEELVIFAARIDLQKSWSHEFKMEIAEITGSDSKPLSGNVEFVNKENIFKNEGSIVLHTIVAICAGYLERKIEDLESSCPDTGLKFSRKDALIFSPIVAGDIVKYIRGIDFISKVNFCSQTNRRWLSKSTAQKFADLVSLRNRAVHEAILSVSLAEVITWYETCFAAIAELEHQRQIWVHEAELSDFLKRLDVDAMQVWKEKVHDLPHRTISRNRTSIYLWFGFILLLLQPIMGWGVIFSRSSSVSDCFFSFFETFSIHLVGFPVLSFILLLIGASLCPDEHEYATAIRSIEKPAQLKLIFESVENQICALKKSAQSKFSSPEDIARIDGAEKNILEIISKEIHPESLKSEWELRLERKLRIFYALFFIIVLFIGAITSNYLIMQKNAESYLNSCLNIGSGTAPNNSKIPIPAKKNSNSPQGENLALWSSLGQPVWTSVSECEDSQKYYVVIFQTIYWNNRPQLVVDESVQAVDKKTQNKIVLLKQKDPSFVGLAAIFFSKTRGRFVLPNWNQTLEQRSQDRSAESTKAYLSVHNSRVALQRKGLARPLVHVLPERLHRLAVARLKSCVRLTEPIWRGAAPGATRATPPLAPPRTLPPLPLPLTPAAVP